MALTRPADKTTLIRRVTLDLTGLPPTPEGAYEKVVERLLHCEQYGERMAAWWLDMPPMPTRTAMKATDHETSGSIATG